MVSRTKFYRAISSFRYPPDKEQRQVIQADAAHGLLVVAGPGSGKTTSLTLRILKLVVVDGVPPTGILATTFTVKAAAELRSRVLGWGFQIIDFLLADPTTTKKQKEYIKSIDINQVWTGTVDSLCEQLLRDYRAPGTQPPVLADEFVAKTLLLRDGIFPGRRDLDSDFEPWLLNVHSESGNSFGFHLGRKVQLAQSIWDRRMHDQLNWKKFVRSGPKADKPARKVLDELLTDYKAALAARGMVDFSLLENEVLARLRKHVSNLFSSSAAVGETRGLVISKDDKSYFVKVQSGSKNTRDKAKELSGRVSCSMQPGDSSYVHNYSAMVLVLDGPYKEKEVAICRMGGWDYVVSIDQISSGFFGVLGD